jgi:predicted lipopolysaccharide heptosyltransferase III
MRNPMLVKGKKFLLQGIKRILLIQLGDIGDLVLTTPAVKALKENHPHSQIFILVRTHARELIEDFPWADGVISVNKEKRRLADEIVYQMDLFLGLRKKKFELAIDLRTGTRGAIISFLSGARLRMGRYSENGRLWRNRLFTHLVRPEDELRQYSTLHNLNILAPLELKIEGTTPKLTVTAGKQRGAVDILRRAKVPLDRPIIAFHPFSRWRYKEWPIRNHIKLINHIGSRYGISIVITGPISEKDRAAEIVRGSKTVIYSLAGATSVGELAGVLGKCSLLIGIDSAPMHIAAAVGTPTVSIFGPSSPTNWAPRGEQHCVLHKDLPCRPCRQKGCHNMEVSRCLEELTAAEVIPIVDNKVSALVSEMKQG